MCPDDEEHGDRLSDAGQTNNGTSQSGDDDESRDLQDTDDELPFTAWDQPGSSTRERPAKPGTKSEATDDPPVAKEKRPNTDKSGETSKRERRSRVSHRLSGYVDELRDFLTESARYLDEIQELVDGLRNAPPAYITELQERVKHVRSRRETIERRLPKGIDSVDDAETYVRDLRRRIDSLDDAVRELQEFLRDAPVPEGVQSTERIERIDDRADSLRRRLADLREHLPGSNCVSNARFTSQDISRRATMAGVSTVFAAVVTRLLFHSDEVVVSTVVFGYGGEVAETEASITTRLSNTQQGYGEYRYGGASGSR